MRVAVVSCHVGPRRVTWSRGLMDVKRLTAYDKRDVRLFCPAHSQTNSRAYDYYIVCTPPGLMFT